MTVPGGYSLDCSSWDRLAVQGKADARLSEQRHSSAGTHAPSCITCGQRGSSGVPGPEQSQKGCALQGGPGRSPHLGRGAGAARLAFLLQALGFWAQVRAGLWAGVGTAAEDLGPWAFWHGGGREKQVKGGRPWECSHWLSQQRPTINTHLQTRKFPWRKQQVLFSAQRGQLWGKE